LPGQLYGIYFSAVGANFRPLFIQKQVYPTQNNCPDSITNRNLGTNFMSVLTAPSQFLYFGLTAPNDVLYAMDIYPVRNDLLNMAVATVPVTLKPSEFTFFSYPANLPPGTLVRITPTTAVATPLLFISSTAQFPTHFDTNPPPTSALPISVGNDVPIMQTDRFASIYNPFGNGNDATFTIQLVNTGPIITPTLNPVAAPTIFPTQNVVLGLSLGAIIGIASGGAVLIAVILVGVWIYSKRRSKRKQEEAYKQVPNSENEKPNEKVKDKNKQKGNKEEEEDSSTPNTSEEDSETDEEEENDYADDYNDSYPPPRKSSYGGGGGGRRPSRVYGGGPPKRGPNRGPSEGRRNRERSYSDDDEEDDYSSDDYS